MICPPRFKHAALPMLSVVALLLAPAPLPAFQQPSLAISSGDTTSTNYAASSAVAKLFNRKSAEYGMRASATPTTGAIATIDTVAQGKTPFGIVQADMLQRAADGTGPWKGKPQKELRAVLALHGEALTVVAAADREIRKIGDLKGKRVNIGAPGSSDREYGTLLLERSGVKSADVTLSELPSSIAAELLQKDDIDAYIYTVGHPNLSVLEASAGKRKVTLIPVDKTIIQQVTASNPVIIPVTIPTNHYPGLVKQGDVSTIGVRAVLFTRADTPDETVYRMVKEVLTNFDLFKRQHPALQDLSSRDVSTITAVPFHPGAERYFREAGLAP